MTTRKTPATSTADSPPKTRSTIYSQMYNEDIISVQYCVICTWFRFMYIVGHGERSFVTCRTSLERYWSARRTSAMTCSSAWSMQTKRSARTCWSYRRRSTRLSRMSSTTCSSSNRMRSSRSYARSVTSNVESTQCTAYTVYVR